MHRKQKPIIKQGKATKQNQITDQETKASQIYTKKVLKKCFEKQGGLKTYGNRMHKGRNRQGRGDLKVQEAWAKERSKGRGGPHDVWR